MTSSVNKADRNRFVDQWLPKTPKRDRVVTKRPVSYGGVMINSAMSKFPCLIPSERRLVVGWDGRCSPCNLDVNMAWASGSVLEAPVDKIVTSRRWKNTMEHIRARRGICANCFDSNNHTSNTSIRGRREP